MIDFSFSCLLKSKIQEETQYWMAPEVIQTKDYFLQSDLWSLGILLFQLMTFRSPYISENPTELFQMIISNELPTLPDTYSEDIRNLTFSLLSKNRFLRMKLKKIEDHPTLWKINQENIETKPDEGSEVHENVDQQSQIENEQPQSENYQSSISDQSSGDYEQIKTLNLQITLEKNKLKTQLDSLTDEFNRYKIKSEQFEFDNNQLKNDYDLLSNENKRLKIVNDQVKNKLEQYIFLTDHHGEFIAEMDRIKEEKSQVNSKLEEEQAKTSTLNTELEQLKDECKQHQIKIDQITTQLNQFKTANDKISDELNQLKEANDKIFDENEKNKTEIKKLNEKNHSLKKSNHRYKKNAQETPQASESTSYPNLPLSIVSEQPVNYLEEAISTLKKHRFDLQSQSLAFALLKKAADSGDMDACWMVAACYIKKLGAPIQLEEAVNYSKKQWKQETQKGLHGMVIVFLPRKHVLFTSRQWIKEV